MDVETYLQNEGIVLRPLSEVEKEFNDKLTPKQQLKFKRIRTAAGNEGRTAEQKYYNFLAKHKGMAYFHGGIKYNEYLETLPVILEKVRGHEKILDVGCGDGLATVFRAINLSDSEITAIDINHNLLRLADQRVKRYKLNNVTLSKEDMIDLPYNKEFGLVLASNVLEESCIVDKLAGNPNIVATFGLFDVKFNSFRKSVKDDGLVIVNSTVLEGYPVTADLLREGASMAGLEEIDRTPLSYNFTNNMKWVCYVISYRPV